MLQALTIQAILDARSQLSDLALEVANDLFAYTWLASHVRLVELVPDEPELNLPVLLAQILTRNPAGGVAMDEWLPKARIQKTAKTALGEAIAGALEDLEEAENDYERMNQLLVHALNQLSIQDAQHIHVLSTNVDHQPPRAPYAYGLTDQYFWVHGRYFYYLEIHRES